MTAPKPEVWRDSVWRDSMSLDDARDVLILALHPLSPDACPRCYGDGVHFFLCPGEVY